MNFSLVPTAACGLQGGKVDLRVPTKLDLLGSLCHVTRTDTGCSNEVARGDAVLIQHKVHAGVFNLVQHTGEDWTGLFDVNFGAVMLLNDVGKAPGPLQHAGDNTASVPTPVAVVLVGSTGYISASLRFYWAG